METLKLEAPLTTREPAVVLDPRLPVGKYRVELVVERNSAKSTPAVAVFVVVRG